MAQGTGKNRLDSVLKSKRILAIKPVYIVGTVHLNRRPFDEINGLSM